ncbi:MAG: DMT family transporter [Ectothiorhodospiraceae bacterium]|nr:DMT family transporter [Chromatiales bacterium]MCP5157060.1 DMT family transporter [Ectothiorhodospiraceae bacterium]
MTADATDRNRPSNGAGRGIAWMVLATALFATQDTIGKYLTQSYPVPQVIWARFAFHLLFALLMVASHREGSLRSRRPGLQLLRSVFMLVANGLFLFAVRSMALVDASALLFVGPLFVTALSVPLLGERVGPRRWAAVAVGFAGAMVIIRPGPTILQSVAILPVLGAFSFALYQIATRVLSRSDPPLTTLFYTALVGTVVTTAALPWHWQPPDVAGWVLLASLGSMGALSQLALIKAIQSAPLTVVVPFNYLTLVWATTFGYLVFGDLPDSATVLGAVIIAGSGLYVLHRERVRARDDTRQRMG